MTKTCNFHVIIIIIFFCHGMWDHSSLTRGQTLSPAVEAQILTTGLPWKSRFVYLISHTHIHTCTQLQGDIHRCEVVPGVFKIHHNNRQLWLNHSRGPVGSSRWRLEVLPLGLTSCPRVPIGSAQPFGTSSVLTRMPGYL